MSERNTSRRDFLKTAAVAGGALAANMSLLSNVHAAGNDVIKVGVIGCGGRGSQAGENVLQAAAGVQVVALGDAFDFRVKNAQKTLKHFAANDEVCKKHGNTVDLPDSRCFAGLDAYQKVIDSGANYIILATPPGFRPTHLEAAIAAGKNIFTEKPVAVDGPGTRKVLAAYEDSYKKNLHIAAGTQRRHQKTYLETIKRIHDGEIGDVVALRGYWNGGAIWFRDRGDLGKHAVPESELAYQLHNWYHFLWTCGDHIVEQHVHNLDVCNWAIGKHPARAVGTGSRIARPTGDPKDVGHIFDNFAIDFEYDNGVHMFSMCRQINGTDHNISEAVVGSKGTCLTADHYTFTLNGKKLYTRQEIEGYANPYVQEHTDLIASIRGDKPLNELKTVAESTLTAILGRMAAYTGKPVTWEQALNSKDNTMPEKLSWNMSLPVPAVAMPGKTPLV
jgi:predicted dehydrogenase